MGNFFIQEGARELNLVLPSKFVSKGFDCKRMEGDAGEKEERQIKARGGVGGKEILKPFSEQSNAQQMPI